MQAVREDENKEEYNKLSRVNAVAIQDLEWNDRARTKIKRSSIVFKNQIASLSSGRVGVIRTSEMLSSSS